MTLLAEKVRYYKEDEEKNRSMSRIVEEEARRERLIAEKRAEARGIKKANEKIALALMQKNFPLEFISEVTGLTLAEITELSNKPSA